MNSDAQVCTMVGLVLGGGALCSGLFLCWRELSPHSWRQVSGKIISTNIVREYVDRGAYQFVPIVEYEYFYEGRMFKSSRRRVGNYVIGLKEEAEAVIARYQTGKAVEVFVNPKNPTKSVLEYSVTPTSWILIGLGSLFCVLVKFTSASLRP